MATHFSILTRKIPWTEEIGGLQPMGLLRAGHDRAGTRAPLPIVMRRVWSPGAGFTVPVCFTCFVSVDLHKSVQQGAV